MGESDDETTGRSLGGQRPKSDPTGPIVACEPTPSPRPGAAIGRILRAIGLIAGVTIALGCSVASPSVTPDGLWRDQAHFVEVGELDWASQPGGDDTESASWFTVRNGVWYAFSRRTLPVAVDYCKQDHTRVVVRESRDRGKTWSAAVVAVDPGESRHGDGCAVLDGSTYYDQPSDTWHMLAQCLDRGNAGGWSLCHYSRGGGSPLGRFVADDANPVVRSGELWSRICGGADKACSPSTLDEGTPDILEKRGGSYFVTVHGYDYQLKLSVRGLVSTPDFRRWRVAGNGLPGDAVLGPADCRAWLPRCSGVGEATTLLTPDHAYMVVETMTGGLVCATNQTWVFQLIRATRTQWRPSGSGAWQRLRGKPLLVPSLPDRGTVCQVAYARWLVDGSRNYLIYEDASPGRAVVHRRVLELVPGGGAAIRFR